MQRHALSPYVGASFRGCVERTIRRGETIFASGEITARSRGKFVRPFLAETFMHHLGQTRSAHRADHILQTPETFVRAPLPGMRKATAIVHISPAVGAQFTQYTAEFEPGGSLEPAAVQRFLYVLEGEVEINGVALPHGDYAYLPPGHFARVSSQTAALRRNHRKALSVLARGLRARLLYGPRKRPSRYGSHGR